MSCQRVTHFRHICIENFVSERPVFWRVESLGGPDRLYHGWLRFSNGTEVQELLDEPSEKVVSKICKMTFLIMLRLITIAWKKLLKKYNPQAGSAQNLNLFSDYLSTNLKHFRISELDGKRQKLLLNVSVN